jgi:hypothetical protein
MSSAPAHTPKINRAAFPTSATGAAVSRMTLRTPFASTLRPNLTGGALPRTAGGYSTGAGRTGGARYFSHTPAAPAQVVNNVSAAVRAFWLSGQKAQFDGVTPQGNKRYRAVSKLQDETGRKMRNVPRFAPGAFIDFKINPTVTALSSLTATFPFGRASAIEPESPTLNTDGFLDVLSMDFARAVKDLAATMNDLKKLSALGDLSISMEDASTLRVRFSGCDAETVEHLCDEVGVKRGVIHQDPEFEERYGGRLALLFPFADTAEPDRLTSPGGSLRSEAELLDEGYLPELEDDPCLFDSPIEGYETRDISETASMFFESIGHGPPLETSSEYEGVEGLYRFIEFCDDNRRIGM